MTDQKDLKDFTILGPGGVGGVLAGLLARGAPGNGDDGDHGRRVRVVASESTARRITADGLRVESEAFGDFTAHPEARAELTKRTDVLFVTVKATTLDAALERISADAVEDALIVPLLNGFEHVDILRSRFPRAHVVAASILVAASRPSPGRVQHTGSVTSVEMAGPAAVADRIDALAAALRTAGITADILDSEDRVLWKKYSFLLPAALVCAHTRLPIGEARVTHRATMAGIVDEARAVAAARGVTIDPDEVLKVADSRPAHVKPSLLFDRENGYPMEIDALGGALLRAARDAGIDTPVTARVVADLEAVDNARTA
ncbi:ketopantoate reductase family protein [Nocardiopsis rhodophaea]|uniref:2-dehydropantoate 2-reductase n=1 Tax=Nocardiopsis rhodophaea TaxID=280238 RepID=A0ABP5F4M9_9ACTN